MERWRQIDAASDDDARAALRMCCGADRWIDRMLARRPFGSRDRAVAAARAEWFALTPDEWREAFSHHPRIGDVEGLRRRFSPARVLSQREQSGVASASADVLRALLEANQRYEERFGYIFIVCASGKSAEEMAEILDSRLKNAPDVEIGIAAGEHAKICELRLGQDIGGT